MTLRCEALYLDCNSLLAKITLKIKGRCISEMAKNGPSKIHFLGKAMRTIAKIFKINFFRNLKLKPKKCLI